MCKSDSLWVPKQDTGGTEAPNGPPFPAKYAAVTEPLSYESMEDCRLHVVNFTIFPRKYGNEDICRNILQLMLAANAIFLSLKRFITVHKATVLQLPH